MKCDSAAVCGGDEAVVYASATTTTRPILRGNVPLCGECAKRYASQAIGHVVADLERLGLSLKLPLTITLRELDEDPRP